MKKIINIVLIIMIIGVTFLPVNKVEASSSYSVEMVSGSSSNRVVGTYNTYGEALNAMNSQNSTETSVATIYRNGVPVDSKYAIFKFKPNAVYKLYKNSGSSSAYTSINSSYGSDAALLGYSDNGRVKIMISGFIGYTDINNGVVTPISLLSGNMINVNGSGVRLRTSPSLSASTITNISGSHNFNYTDTRNADGYTWYKINYNGTEAWVAGGDWVTRYNNSLGTYYSHYGPSGNLIHHFEIYSGVNYTDSFTNLGTSPSFLAPDVRYYSFDGNYFYSNITSMLDDYRTNNYTRSINKDNPYYSYYLYLTARSTTGYTADDLNNIIASKGYSASSSKMYGTGQYFKEAESTYGTNALLAFSAALNESNWGTSSIAMNKNNLFGYGAYDSCPYDCAYTYSSPKDSIMSYASSAASSYESVTGKYYYGSHYGNKASGKNIMYATDPYWGEKMAMNAFLKDKSYGGKDFNSNTIGVAKKSVDTPWVFDRPEQNGTYLLYKLKNQNSSDRVQDISVNIIDKVENNGIWFYKIYTDMPDRNPLYGYVWADEWNITNNQPVINAENKEIKQNESFDYMNGVTAIDTENGDLTSKVTYEGSVDTSKEGKYKVKYTVVDNSNFHSSKEIEVKVVSDNKVEIEAQDREITQFDEFDYLEGVRAYNKDNDLTDKLTYSKTVDTSKEGIYEVIYKINIDGTETTKKINVKVNKNEKPIIEAHDIESIEGNEVDILNNVSAIDKEDGDLTNQIKYEGNFDINKPGTYEITYYVSDKNNQEASKKIKLTILKDSEPIINAKDREINLNKEFNPLEGVIAIDKEDGDITNKIQYTGSVDTSKEGEYKVTYFIEDSKNHRVEKTITVKVTKKTLKEAKGRFDLEYFKYIGDNLTIKGFSTIEGIDNTLENAITYKIEFVNIETGNTFIQDLHRITEKEKIPYVIPSNDNKNYAFSWFEGNIDINLIEEGNYEMNIIASSDDYYSKTVVNNQLFSEQVASRKDKSGKYILTNIDYFNDDAPLQLIIRNEKLADKTADATSTQYGQFEELNFKDDKLHIYGNSFSYGANLGNDIDVQRNIIFENIKTLKRYTFDLGWTEKKLYDVKMPVNDKLSKNKAWYEGNIDISELEKGNYIIYINTISNISDISLLNDQLFSNLDGSKTINGKKYSFKVNYDKQYRVELIVE